MIRVVTYNIEFGQRERLEAVSTVLTQCKADIITLNEADDEAVVAELAERLGFFHVWARGSGDRHVGTLSRFPILEWKIYRKPPLTQAALYTAIDTPSGRLGVYNLHFLPYLLLPYEMRRWQAVGKLLKIIANRASEPHLLMGDINSIGAGDRVLQRNNPIRMQRVMRWQLGIIFRLAIPRLLRAGYTDGFRMFSPSDDGFTWMPGNRTTRYDYIMACPQTAGRLQSCRVVDDVDCLAEASDHFPLLATLSG